MKISTKGIYALEIIVDLAVHTEPEQLESLKNIADRRQLSEKYLERIAGMLKKAGLVRSVRGAYGGYCLARPAEEITALEVLQAVEGDLAPVKCLVYSEDCKIECEKCATRGTWGEMWERIKDVTQNLSIAELAGHAG